MTEITPLDLAHADMLATDSDTDRLKFFEQLAQSELFVLLASEVARDTAEPRIFDVEDGKFVAVFDREARLAEFAGATVPYVCVSGRALAGMLSGRGLGIGLNLGVAQSSFLVPSDAVDWLSDTVSGAPDPVDDTPGAFHAPLGVPEAVIMALNAKLALAVGMARMCYLVSAEYQSGRRGHLLVIVDAAANAQTALTAAVSEALVFSGIEAGEIDVTFLDSHDPACANLARVGLRFDLLDPVTPTRSPSPPGSDPAQPPKLR